MFHDRFYTRLLGLALTFDAMFVALDLATEQQFFSLIGMIVISVSLFTYMHSFRKMADSNWDAFLTSREELGEYDELSDVEDDLDGDGR